LRWRFSYSAEITNRRNLIIFLISDLPFAHTRRARLDQADGLKLELAHELPSLHNSVYLEPVAGHSVPDPEVDSIAMG
jgi:hypothetical protein